jgi:hypothetical protein
MPLLEKYGVIVTDNERAIRNAIKEVLDIEPLLCWNHFKKSVERWVRSRNGKNDDVLLYTTQLKQILKSENKELGLELANGFRVDWDREFIEYYDNNIFPNLDALGKWVLEPLGIYCPYSGVTTNACEGLKNLYKSLNGYKEVPIDVAALSYFKLSVYYANEIKRGFASCGLYSLKTEYSHLKVTYDEVSLRPAVKIEEIVSEIKENHANELMAMQVSETNEIEPSQATTSQASKLVVDVSDSKTIRAKNLIQQNGIVINVQLGVFNVKDGEEVYVVKLNAKSCSCLEGKNCCHVLAVGLSTGTVIDKPKRLNLNKLRSKTRGNKKAGRKYRENEKVLVINKDAKESDKEEDYVSSDEEVVEVSSGDVDQQVQQQAPNKRGRKPSAVQKLSAKHRSEYFLSIIQN